MSLIQVFKLKKEAYCFDVKIFGVQKYINLFENPNIFMPSPMHLLLSNLDFSE